MKPMRSLAAFLAAAVLTACSATADATSVPSASLSDATPAASPRPSDGGRPASTATATATVSSSATASERAADALLDTALTDVRSGDTFTLGDLAATEGPVLLEPMAIWCSNCRAQQHQVGAAHGLSGAFASVSLDVDLSEAAGDLATYADAEGFHWRFAMASAELYRLLQDRFGVAATNPPSTPLIVIERDGTVRPLEFGVGRRSAEQLLAELGLG